MSMKCIAIDRNRANCRNHKINDTEFCKLHQYMCEYTPEMLNNLSICSGCNKCYYLTDGRKTCDNCANRGKKTREENKEEIILCGHIGCKFKKSSENKYCLKHQLDIFLDSALEMGKKTCRNVIKGCRELLDADYEFSRCENCRIKEREADKKRRNKVTEIIESDTISYLIQEDETEIRLRMCSACFKDKPETEYKPERGTEMTKTCRDCRDQQKILDSRRDKEHRNEVARKNEAKPERKEVKREWAENNPEKVALGTLNYRARQLETNQEGYLSRNAENMKKWRERNPEKVDEANTKKINSIDYNYKELHYSAVNRGYECILTIEDYAKIIIMPCHYCGENETYKSICGVDRVDSSIGYNIENCVSCCSMCNRMKGCLHKNIYLMRIEHILTHTGFIVGKKHPHIFGDHIGSNYSTSVINAVNRNIEHEITESQHYDIINNECYMCGKTNTNCHRNGVDRYDSNIGYIFENCRPCCLECNLMKLNYDYDDMISKFVKTYNNFNTYIDSLVTSNDEISINGINKIKRNLQKKSKEEIRENSKICKQKQREQQREKYGDEEYRRMKAEEIAEQRRKRKEKQSLDNINVEQDE